MLSELIITYLFLGGMGAGCSLVTALLSLAADPAALDAALRSRMASAGAGLWKRFFGALNAAALAALLLGAICLLADLGRPDRLLLLLFEPHPTYVAFGAWSIVILMATQIATLLLWGGVLKATRTVAVSIFVITAGASACVVLYTGLMLSGVSAVPLWGTPWLVVLFALSALSCGIALAMVAAFASRTLKPFRSSILRLAQMDAVLIVGEVLVGAFCLLSIWLSAGGSMGPATGTDAAAFSSMEELLVGSWAVLFWVGFAIIGLLVPFIQEIVFSRRLAQGGTLADPVILFLLGTAACVLLGGFLLRLLVVEAAIQPVLSFVS